MNSFILVLALLPQAHAPYPKQEPATLIGKWRLVYNGEPGSFVFKPNGTYIETIKVHEDYVKYYGKYRYYSGFWEFNKKTKILKLNNERYIESDKIIILQDNVYYPSYEIKLNWNGYRYVGGYSDKKYELDFQLHNQWRK
jgi:hypothetical protein